MVNFQKLPDRTALLLIRAYQFIFRPILGQRCRFYPSCSQYLAEAILEVGLIRALYLTLLRLLKCHPFHPGGYDPVKKVSK